MNNWNQKRKSYHIGIDTGVNTGIAIWSCNEKKLIDVKTVKIHVAMDIVRQYAQGSDVTVVVEDARKRKWIPKQATDSAERGRRAGAGSVKRDASVWEDYLSDLGVKFQMISPKKGLTKLSKENFIKITKYAGSTSNHGRDAAMLVFSN